MSRILAVASPGGHWTQLSILRDSFESANTIYMTTVDNPAIDTLKKSHSVVKVPSADRDRKLKSIYLALVVCWHVFKLRPKVVISTGAAAGFFAIYFGRLVGAKTIWIDSIANHSKLSLSGEKVSQFADVTLTQWEHLEEKNIQYWGQVL